MDRGQLGWVPSIILDLLFGSKQCTIIINYTQLAYIASEGAARAKIQHLDWGSDYTLDQLAKGPSLSSKTFDRGDEKGAEKCMADEMKWKGT